MTPEEKARLLARWLDHPDEPVADGLDEDVVEAVVALRPELAPPPRVTPDEILGMVTTGPLASSAVVDEAPVAPEVEAEPTAEPMAEVVAFPTRRWGRWAAGGVVGLMAAAAALVIVVVPGTLFLTGTGEDQVAMAPTASAPSAEPRKDSALEVRAPADRGPAEVQLEGDAVADLGEAETEEPLGSLGYVDAPREAVASGTAAGPSPSTTARELIPEVVTTRPAPEPADAGYDAVADLDLEMEEEEDLRAPAEYAPAEYAPAAAAEPVAGVAAGGAKATSADDAVAWEEDEALQDYEADLGRAETAESVALSRSSRADRVKRKQRAPRAGGAGLPAPEKTEVADSPAPPPPADLSALRAAAMPTDYAMSHATTLDGSTRASLEASQDAATELAGERRFAEAGDALLPHVAPPPEVGMDQAATAARYYMSAGDAARAATACQAGLALSTANTPVRSYLLVFYGDALRQSGDAVGAEAAYRQAISLNEARGPSPRYYDAMEAAEPGDH